MIIICTVILAKVVINAIESDTMKSWKRCFNRFNLATRISFTILSILAIFKIFSNRGASLKAEFRPPSSLEMLASSIDKILIPLAQAKTQVYGNELKRSTQKYH